MMILAGPLSGGCRSAGSKQKVTTASRSNPVIEIETFEFIANFYDEPTEKTEIKPRLADRSAVTGQKREESRLSCGSVGICPVVQNRFGRDVIDGDKAVANPGCDKSYSRG